MNNPEYILVPFQILEDKRLNLRHIRVLLAILSWRKSKTKTARVSREILSEKTGYPVSRISNITTELQDLGWLKKIGNGGKSQWIIYEILGLNGDQISNRLNSKKPVSKQPQKEELNGDQNGNDDRIGNGYQNGIQTVTESVTQTVTESVTPIDTETNTKTIQKLKEEKPVKEKWILPEWVNLAAWKEFEQHRKEIKQPLSDLARTKAANLLKDFSFLEQQTAVNNSIQSRWAGLFPKKLNGGQNETGSRTNQPKSNVQQFWDDTKARVIASA